MTSRPESHAVSFTTQLMSPEVPTASFFRFVSEQGFIPHPEEFMSVRNPVTRRHKSMCCLVPSLKMGRMIRCESMLEGDAVGIFDHSTDVRAFMEQPCTEHVFGDGKLFRYTPDFQLILINGAEEYIEIKLEKNLRSPKLKRRLNQIAKHFEKTGRRFRIMTDLEIRNKPLRRNLKLHSYHARTLPPNFEFESKIQALSEIHGLTFGIARAILQDNQAVMRLISRGCLAHDTSTVLTDITPLTFVSKEARHAAFQI